MRMKDLLFLSTAQVASNDLINHRSICNGVFYYSLICVHAYACACMCVHVQGACAIRWSGCWRGRWACCFSSRCPTVPRLAGSAGSWSPSSPPHSGSLAFLTSWCGWWEHLLPTSFLFDLFPSPKHLMLFFWLCPGDSHWLHSGHPRCHHGNYIFGRRHQCPRLHGEPYSGTARWAQERPKIVNKLSKLIISTICLSHSTLAHFHMFAFFLKYS